MSSPRIGKYACLEVERKYLLDALPPGLVESAPHWEIVDDYLPETRLRLRRMTASDGETVIYKLTQKYRTPDQDPTQATITNLYLEEEEYRQLRSLAAYELTKRRYVYLSQGRQYSIDLFTGPHAGQILAETECETAAEAEKLILPDFAVCDVTGEREYNGGVLAQQVAR